MFDPLVGSVNVADLVAEYLSPLPVMTHVIRFDYVPNNLCNIWRRMATNAYKNDCDFFVLFGDDIYHTRDSKLKRRNY